MFGIFKKRDPDNNKYLRGMFSRDSTLNVRDEMSEIIGNVLETAGYESFIDGTIFVNDDWNVGWANTSTGVLVTRDGIIEKKALLCSVAVSDVMNREDCKIYEMMLSDKESYNDMPKEVREYYLGGISNVVCNIFAKKSDKFRTLPPM